MDVQQAQIRENLDLNHLDLNNQDLRIGGLVALLRGSIIERLLELYVVGKNVGDKRSQVGIWAPPLTCTPGA